MRRRCSGLLVFARCRRQHVWLVQRRRVQLYKLHRRGRTVYMVSVQGSRVCPPPSSFAPISSTLTRRTPLPPHQPPVPHPPPEPPSSPPLPPMPPRAPACDSFVEHADNDIRSTDCCGGVTIRRHVLLTMRSTRRLHRIHLAQWHMLSEGDRHTHSLCRTKDVYRIESTSPPAPPATPPSPPPPEDLTIITSQTLECGGRIASAQLANQQRTKCTARRKRRVRLCQQFSTNHDKCTRRTLASEAPPNSR